MSATGDELFSKLTDIVRELKDAKEASDRRIDATDDTLKDVKDTLHESARYDKATAESFKKLLEATKEHSKLLKDLKPVRGGESDLLKAMKLVAQTGKGRENQIPSMGCSIKWFK